MAVLAGCLHPAAETVAFRRERQRNLSREYANGLLRTGLGQAEPADDNGDAGTARAGPWPGIDVERATAIRAITGSGPCGLSSSMSRSGICAVRGSCMRLVGSPTTITLAPPSGLMTLPASLLLSDWTGAGLVGGAEELLLSAALAVSGTGRRNPWWLVKVTSEARPTMPRTATEGSSQRIVFLSDLSGRLPFCPSGRLRSKFTRFGRREWRDEG